MYYISIFATSVWRLHTLLFYLSLQMCFSYISIVYNSPFQSYLVQFSLIWSNFIHFGPIRSIIFTLVLFGPLCLIQSTLVLFGPHWSHFVHYVHFGPIWSFLSALVLFGPLGLIRGHFGAIRSTSVHLLLFSRFWSYSVLSVCFGSIRSYLGISVHFGPL